MSHHMKLALVGTLFLATSCASAPAVTTAASTSMPTRTEQTSGTRALLIAVSPVNENVVWVSGSSGTWLRTIDGGTTWQAGKVPGADSLQFRDVHAVDANTAYLLSIGNGTDSRIYKTSDAGKNWTLQFRNTDPKAFYDCLSFWDPKRAVVVGDAIGTELAILSTGNGGASWTKLAPNTLPAAVPNEGSFAASGLCINTLAGGHAWIVSNNADYSRLLHSADYGRTWKADTIPLTTRDGSGAASVSFRDKQHGVILGGGTTAKKGDYQTAVTSDGGRTWTRGTSPNLNRGFWGGVYVPGAKQPVIVGVGPDGAVYSRDNGMTWTSIDSNNYWSLGFASPRAGWLVGQNGRITKISGF